MEPDDHLSDPIVTAFLARLADDVDASRRRSLPEYQALFPGHEETIAREYAAVAAAPIDSAGVPGRIGPFTIQSRLGSGGSGTVYLAEDARLSRRVALKVLHALTELSADGLERFQREAALAARLDHPFICGVLESGVADDVPFLAMRYVPGETLAKRLRAAKDAGRSPDREAVLAAVALVEKVARALDSAHEAGVIHRDVKPANVMVTPGGDPVVLDFGVARDLDAEPLTRSWEVYGTLAYMSPEQLAREPLDRRTDVYSLGVTLYEATTLERPFDAPSIPCLLDAIRTREPRSPRNLNAAIPPDLAIVIGKALEKDRARRYSSAHELAEELRRVRCFEPIAARPAGSTERIVQFARRRPARFALIVLLVLGVPAFSIVAGFLFAKLPEARAFREQAQRTRVARLVEDGFLQLATLRPAQALAEFQRALTEDPSYREAHAGVARALLHLDRDEEALAYLDAHAHEMPGLVAIEEMRRSARRALGRDAAGSATDADVPAAPGDPVDPADPDGAFDAYLLGLEQMRHTLGPDEGAVLRARRLFEQAVLLAPAARSIYHFELARTIGLTGDAEGARAIAKALERHWPDSSIAAFYAGFALQGTGQIEAATERLERAVGLDPTNVLALNGLGAAYFDAGRIDEAIPKFEATLALDPRDHSAHFCLALAAEAAGDRAGAARHYEASLEKDPDNPHALAGVARCRDE